MNIIHVTIELIEGQYIAHATNIEDIVGVGNTIEDAKQDLLSGIEVLKLNEEPYKCPDILKGEYIIKYDEDIYKIPEDPLVTVREGLLEDIFEQFPKGLTHL